MISLELAKKLNASGIKQKDITTTDKYYSLSQLLAEIEGRGYLWNLDHSTGRYLCQIGKWKWEKCIWADTPEDAAGAALLWILEREKDE